MNERAIPVRTLCQTRHLSPVATHHRFLFLAAPTLDLLFGCQSFFPGRTFLAKNQFNRQSPGGIAIAQPALMFADALFEVVSVSGVVRVVGTTQDVNPEAHDFALRKISPFDKLRANGVVGTAGYKNRATIPLARSPRNGICTRCPLPGATFSASPSRLRISLSSTMRFPEGWIISSLSPT